jgi:hypothetical protein
MTRTEALAVIRSETAAVSDLARVLSIAVVIEPALLRRARLHLLHLNDPGIEADLWFSGLVHSRGPQGIILIPAVAEALRLELRHDPERLLAARRLVLEAHAYLPPTLTLEEEIAFLAAENEAGASDRIRDRLAAAVRALVEGGTDRAGIAQWAVGALARLPEIAVRTESARILDVASRVRIGERLPAMDDAPEWLSWVVPERANRRRVSVRLLRRALEFGSNGTDAHELELPDTNPMLVQVESDNSITTVEITPGKVQRIAVQGLPIRVRTVAGEVYELTAEIGFQHDIYISYSRDDDQWVHLFTQSLEARLLELLGKPIRIWRDDQQRRAGDDWQLRTEEAIRGSAVFLVIVSPSYIQSEYCRRELQVFNNTSRETGILTHDNFVRLLPVGRMPVEPTFRSVFGDVQWVEFFAPDRRSGEPVEFEPQTREFNRALDKTANVITKTLAAARAGQRAVFVSDAGSDESGRRHYLVLELEGRGFRVLPEYFLPREPAARSNIVRELIGRVESCVILLGDTWDPAIEEDYNITRAYLAGGGPGGFRCFVWLPRDLKVEEGRQRAFIEQVKQVPEGVELIESGFRSMVEDVLNGLNRPLAMRRETRETVIYVICAPQDSSAAQEIAALLQEREPDITTRLSSFDKGPRQTREMHRQNLQDANGILIYWGSEAEMWLQANLYEVMRERSAKRKVNAILVGPPETLEKEQFRAGSDFLILREKELRMPGSQVLRRLVQSWQASL